MLYLTDRISGDDAAMDEGADLSSLRLAVSAGETLRRGFRSWTRKTGKPILDGIGSTELFTSSFTNRIGDAFAGTTDPGFPVTRPESSTMI